MVIFLASLIAFFFGYLYGHKIRPNRQLRKAVKEVKEKCTAVLAEGNKGVYRTVVTENNRSSELTVEVKELAVTRNGQVKVQYLSAFYQNPEFRTKKGDALLAEVHGLLGEYLPINDIEWYESSERHAAIKNYVHSLDTNYRQQLGA
jgi:hypothetical protein